MNKLPGTSSSDRPLSLTLERIVIAGVIAGITILLTIVPGLGFIPLPNLSGGATIGHIPTIIGSIIGGPIVGLISGFVFGMMSFLQSNVPAFKDPLVSILPRIFIGLVSWLVFAAVVDLNRDLAAILAGAIGSLTNTVLVITMLIVRGFFPAEVIIPAVLPQAIAEAIVSAILTVLIVRAFFIIQGRYTRARDVKPRDELPY